MEQALSNVYREHPEYKTAPLELGLKGCELWQCPELPGKVSICGGGGQIFNHAALSLLFDSDGPDKLFSEFLSKSGQPDDPVVACALQKRGGQLVNFDTGNHGQRIVHKENLDNAIDKEEPTLFHYLNTPAVMRYVHARMRGEKNLNSTEAFVDGCCCFYHKEDCSNPETSFLETPSSVSHHQMAVDYIEARKHKDSSPSI